MDDATFRLCGELPLIVTVDRESLGGYVYRFLITSKREPYILKIISHSVHHPFCYGRALAGFLFWPSSPPLCAFPHDLWCFHRIRGE